MPGPDVPLASGLPFAPFFEQNGMVCTEDILGHPVLCVASSTDQTWPLMRGVFNLDDTTAYWVRLAPQGSDKLKFSACGLGGWYCPSKGEFAWTKARD